MLCLKLVRLNKYALTFFPKTKSHFPFEFCKYVSFKETLIKPLVAMVPSLILISETTMG
jgi:hypothetical protein